MTAGAPLLQAEDAALGQTVTTLTVNNLPLATRDWGSLAQLAAGVATAPPGQPTADSGSTESAYFSVDGGNVWQNDAVEEFKVQNGVFNAVFGHSTGGVVNAAIKSGTNQIHGDLWEYVRNDAFNANYFFNAGHSYRNTVGTCLAQP